MHQAWDNQAHFLERLGKDLGQYIWRTETRILQDDSHWIQAIELCSDLSTTSRSHGIALDSYTEGLVEA
jgi:hypothetical protein